MELKDILQKPCEFLENGLIRSDVISQDFVPIPLLNSNAFRCP